MKSTSPRFWNKNARRYARSPIADEAAYRRKLELTQARMRPDMHVMEFGCGTGGTALIHAPHVARYLATDFSETMVEIAREKAATQGANPADTLEFEVASIETMPAPARPWDMVLGLSILHLVPDRRAIIDKVYDILAPGGYFVTSTVCLHEMPWYMRTFIATFSGLRIFPYVKLLRADTVRDEMRAAGFVIEEDWHPGPKAALFLIARKPG